CFFFSSRRRHTRCYRDWSSDECSSDLVGRHRCAQRRRSSSRRVSRPCCQRRVGGAVDALCQLCLKRGGGLGDGLQLGAERRLERSEERRVGKGWWWRRWRVEVERKVVD